MTRKTKEQLEGWAVLALLSALLLILALSYQRPLGATMFAP